MPKDLVKAYFKAKENLNEALKDFYYEGPFYDMTDYRWTVELGETSKPYYLGYDEASKYIEGEDFMYSVDHVNSATELGEYKIFFCHDNGEEFVLIFSESNFVRRDEE